MDIVGEEQGRLERFRLWLDASRVELIGLAVLLSGSVAAVAILWWSAQEAAPPPPVASGIATDPDPTRADEGSGAAPTDPGTASEPGAPDAGAAASRRHGTDGSGASHTSGERTGLTVHVTGAVVTPGVLEVDDDARVGDAVRAAGGATDEGEPHRLNLARPLTDGEQVHVPRRGEPIVPPDGDGTEATDAQGRVDLNRADAAALETLPGVGPARADAIIGYREEHGPFTEPGDLRGVSGIGEVTFQRLAEHVTVS